MIVNPFYFNILLAAAVSAIDVRYRMWWVEMRVSSIVIQNTVIGVWRGNSSAVQVGFKNLGFYFFKPKKSQKTEFYVF